MNLIDPGAGAELAKLAPRTHQWLLDIRDGKHADSGGELYLSPLLQPLLDIIMRTFTPLMAQNESAWTRACESGETLFNEAAFDQGRSLYDGELLGKPFRAVVKTFQVSVWRDLCSSWQQLSESERESLKPSLPGWQLFTDG